MKEAEGIKRIEEIRKQIDSLDQELLKILKQRFGLVTKIGKIKAAFNLPVYQKTRWLYLLGEHVKRGETMGFEKNFIYELMRLIHKESMRLQKIMKTKAKEQ
jgi:chorismate mutase